MRPIGNTKPSLRPLAITALDGAAADAASGSADAVTCACTCQNHGNGGRKLHVSCTRFFRRCALTFNGNFLSINLPVLLP